jgi:hypothetical protein
MIAMRDMISQSVVVLMLLCGVACTTGGRRSSGSSGYPGQGNAVSEYQVGSPADPNLVLKLADVDGVVATYEPSPTPHARVVISGTLNDGATRIHDIRQQRIPGGVTISVITARPRDAVATLAIIPFERVVTVALQGQPAGQFSISANGAATAVVVP